MHEIETWTWLVYACFGLASVLLIVLIAVLKMNSALSRMEEEDERVRGGY